MTQLLDRTRFAKDSVFVVEWQNQSKNASNFLRENECECAGFDQQHQQQQPEIPITPFQKTYIVPKTNSRSQSGIAKVGKRQQKPVENQRRRYTIY